LYTEIKNLVEDICAQNPVQLKNYKLLLLS